MSIKTILHIDDNSVALKLMNNTLRGVAQAISVTNENDAKLEWEKQTIDCFIIDYNLSQKTGLEVGRMIRAVPQYTKTPMILMTSTLSEELLFLAMRIGFNRCISKVVAAADVKSQIFEQLINPESIDIPVKNVYFHTMSWEKNDLYFQFTPDFMLTTEGKTADEAHKKMEKMIEEKFAMNPGVCHTNIFNTKIHKHIIPIAT